MTTATLSTKGKPPINLRTVWQRLPFLARAAGWWTSQPPRHQSMVLVALVALGVGAMDLGVLGKTDQQQAALKMQLQSLQQQAARAQAEAARVEQEQRGLRSEESALRSRLATAEAAIASAKSGLVDPAALRQRIRDLSQDSSVRLVALATLPSEPVQSAATSTAAPAAAASAPGTAGMPGAVLYRMPIQVTVSGPYEALGDYLERLEASEAGLRWQSLSLDNRDWPSVKLELRLFVLGDRPVWKGP
jgi:TolA-binding protein